MKILNNLYDSEITTLAKKSIDFHCHGIGRFDFTEIPEIKLQEIEELLAARNQRVILTLYLPKPNFNDFIHLLEVFNQEKKSGKLSHIVGIGLEGPLLASHGGTPAEGVWMPSKSHWKQLASCGNKGLIYVILSPDARFDSMDKSNSLDSPANNIAWVAETLLDGGVLPAPGHFAKTNPLGSARALQSVFDVVAAWGYMPTITDHLFNDMPLSFKHAWRTPEEKIRRQQEIELLELESWSLDKIGEYLGPVPATMIRNAHKGLVKLCQNFDGEHVDLAIVKKAVELVGAQNMLMMTDSVESKRLAGRQLHTKNDSTLLYQDEGIVAAGSQNTSSQIKNMLSVGLDLKQIEMITSVVPSTILSKHNQYTHAEVEHI